MSGGKGKAGSSEKASTSRSAKAGLTFPVGSCLLYTSRCV